MLTGNIEKWQLEFEKHYHWNKEKSRKIQKKEAKIILNWLLKENLKNYQILEIGCGNGYLGQIITEETKKRFNQKDNHTICFSQIDVYQADRILGEKTQKIILSTGFASPASYKEAVPIVSRILAPGGILIYDFINQLSLFLILIGFPGSVLNLLAFYRNLETENPYHFGKWGIKDFFSSHDLKLIKSKTITLKRNPLLCMFKKTGSINF